MQSQLPIVSIQLFILFITSLQFYRQNEFVKLMLEIIYYLLICKHYVLLNYIIHIYFIDLKLEQIKKLSVYLSNVVDYGII